MDNIRKPEKKWINIKDKNNPETLKEAKKNEFAEGVVGDFDINDLSKISRRKFLAALGMTAAFAACDNYRDKGTFSAQNKGDEVVKPGKTVEFASACSGCHNHCGVIVKTREGRPIKIDGNPDNFSSGGKICSTGQASILNLYDPKRLKSSLKKNGKGFISISNEEAIKEFKKIFYETVQSGKEFAFITTDNSSILLKRTFDFLKEKFLNVGVYSYSIFSGENLLKAWNKFYGTPHVPSFKLDKAEVIVSFNSDFLGAEGNFPKAIHSYSKTKNVDDINAFSRLYVFEGAFSLTGANADYRLRILPDRIFDFAMAVVNYLTNEKGLNYPVYLKNIVEESKNYEIKKLTAELSLKEDYINVFLKDLIDKKGKILLLPGDTLTEEAIAAILTLNEILEGTNFYDYNYAISRIQYEDVNVLLDKIKRDQIGGVAFLDCDPVFDLPALNFREILSVFGHSFAFAEIENDTSHACKYQIPISHYLECWNIYQTSVNSYAFQQPIIYPLFDSLQKEEVLLNLVVDTKIRDFFTQSIRSEIYEKENIAADFDAFLFAILQKGYYEKKNKTIVKPRFSYQSPLSKNSILEKDFLRLELRYNYFLRDGKYANNGWLQELPHPISRITWGNYAAISKTTADKLSLKDEDLIEIVIDNDNLKLPILIQPGMADNLIAIELGYGRKKAGIVGDNVGFNAGVFLRYEDGEYKFIRKIEKAYKSKGKYKLASVQEHHALDDEFVKDLHKKRSIILETTVAQYIANPNLFNENKHEIKSINPPFEYKEEKWGMAIDLNKCVGCGACVAACNVENNIPVVGAEQVIKSREMHWIRIDRYYSGEVDDPRVSLQPMLCQHCDNAPCENVCPVVATTHSPDGLNQMAYNRCVGTRYCANNCPYKVRRFNFFNYRVKFADGIYYEDSARLANNPEVTVRSRGVMEKCTFCVQRIMEARQNAIKENRKLKEGDILTACQEACPADAIVFGNLNDLNSKVSYWHNHNLGYKVLEILNVKPNVTYVAKLRNIEEKNDNKEA